MINVSNEFKNLMAEDNRDFLVYLDITLKNGTTLDTLTNPDIWQDGFKINDGVTQNGQFTVGSCIINKLTVILNNIYDKFSAYDFDAAVVTAYMGLELSDGRIERIRKGVFTVDDPQYDGSTITLECLDNMHKFDVDYSEVKTTYPATLGTIVQDICDYCGVPFITPRFENYTYEVKERPEDDALSCRQVLAYCAQLSCHFGRCDTYGRLEFKWFNQAIFEKNDNLDGRIFDDGEPSYVSGDNADGGDFDDYSSGDHADGGTFDDLNEFHHLYSLAGLNVCTDDVVITGVEVTEEFAETEKEKRKTVLNGNKGYVISISGNKLIQKGTATKVSAYLGQKLIGLKFRPMSTQTLGDPTIEAGDLAYVTDRRQNTYNCLVTNLTYTIGGFMDVSCDAETPGKNSAKQYTELTQAIVEARRNTQAQISEYDLAVQALTSLITQSFGVYKTAEEQPDGSTIYYMHEKPTLAESKTIWKMTADAFAVSTDGGKTWNAGMDSKGNAVVNVLSAIGINCDWIHAGTLVLGGYNNQNGRIVMQDNNGKKQGHWDNGSFYTIGPITSDNPKDKYSICIYNGQCLIYGEDGTLYGYLTYRSNIGVSLCSCDNSGIKAAIDLDRDGNINVHGTTRLSLYGKERTDVGGEIINFSPQTLRINGGTTKTGRAEFSDGSYLQFRHGILVGGRTSEGGAF